MTSVLVLHHALGLTEGIRRFADTLRADGHDVVAPDLFDGATFETLEQGVMHAQSVGFDTIGTRGMAAAEAIGEPLVAIGFSLGVVPAQQLAQTGTGVLGAVLCHAAIPASAFGVPWPEGVALQVHIGSDDPWAEEDLPAARELVEQAGGELFEYEGGHLIAEPGSPDHDPAQAAVLTERIQTFLRRF